MRNPYIVGSYVTGSNHYGRQRLIDHLLHSADSAIWVVGNRRMGKTSLLRQIELLTKQGDTPYVPVFWDIQGCVNGEDLARELGYALEDAGNPALLQALSELRRDEYDAYDLIRIARRAALDHGRVLLLLIDEAEALISVAREDQQAIQRLRKGLLLGNGLRVIMTGTKALTEINDLCADWLTSPFLFGFGLRNLWELDWAASEALIRQTQSPNPVQVEPELVEFICEQTNRHPYLMQVLCQRLWQEDNSLRKPTEADLMVDEMLASFCRIDFHHLAPTERQILLTVSERGLIPESEVAAVIGKPQATVDAFIYSLIKLGYLRRVYGQLAVGNQFLASWLQTNLAELRAQQDSRITDESTQELARRGQEQERAYIEEQLEIQQQNLMELERQRSQFGLRVPLDLVNEINLTRRQIERLYQELEALNGGAVSREG
ncbi:MAG: hypothetical protein Kow0047_12890 [Anaerolineae bacterium]